MRQVTFEGIKIEHTSYHLDGGGLSIDITAIHVPIGANLKHRDAYEREDEQRAIYYRITNPTRDVIEAVTGRPFVHTYDAVLADIVQELRKAREYREDMAEGAMDLDQEHPVAYGDDGDFESGEPDPEEVLNEKDLADDLAEWNSEEDGPPSEPDYDAVSSQERAEADYAAKYYGKGL